MFEDQPYKNLSIFKDDSREAGAIIEELAQALEPDDILDAWAIDLEELQEQAVGNDDLSFFMYYYKRGRVIGKRKAVQSIMNGMGSMNGAQVAEKYLSKFTSSWPNEEGGDSIGNITVQFNQDRPPEPASKPD